jgi:DNA-binding NarL/FixJ family response regulator
MRERTAPAPRRLEVKCAGVACLAFRVAVSHRRPAVTLLIIEDALPVRQAMRAAFERIAGVRVAGEAEDATRAIRLLQQLRPDVVTIDVRLKDSFGTDVLRELIKSKSPMKPITVMLTNHVDQHIRSTCKQLGADHFFDKANEFRLACELIERIAARGRRDEVRHG